MVVFQRLEQALGAALAGEVRFDNGARAAYASDASNYRQVPLGAGTSMCGQSVNAALVIDCSKYLDCVLAVDAASRTRRPTLHLAELLA